MGFWIGVEHPKREVNVGSLWRSAYLFGAEGVFVVDPKMGTHWFKQASDTTRAERHIEALVVPHIAQVIGSDALFSYELVAIETGLESIPLMDFQHSEDTVYVLGNEVRGLTPALLAGCNKRVRIDTVLPYSLNVAVAGSIVLWDRHRKKSGVPEAHENGDSTVANTAKLPNPQRQEPVQPLHLGVLEH